MYGFTTLAIAALAAVSAALPTGTSEIPDALVARGISDTCRLRRGDGSTGAGWPHIKQWGSWDELWKVNSALMKQTCGWNGYSPENSGAEIASIKKAILKYASEVSVDRRFILAIVMQESNGCVRVRTTRSNDGSVVNPGLMQTHQGTGTCAGRSSCPDSMIDQMIKDGVKGTAAGDGLRQTLTKAMNHFNGQKEAKSYYWAARIYNSGSATWGRLEDGRGATNCYATDIASRVQGMTKARCCNL